VTKLEPLDDETEKFLAQFKPQTRQTYRNRIKAFTRDTGMTSVLSWIEKTDPKELKSYLQTYYNKQMERGAKINSVLATVTALRSIATEFGKTIKFRKGAFYKVEEDQNGYDIASSDLTKLFEVSDLIEKAVLATATSLGYDISSFLALKRQKIKALVDKAVSENEQWAYWADNRSKTSAKRLNVLNPLAVKYLKMYLDSGMKGGSENLFPYEETGINAMLKRLFAKAAINTAGQWVRFHSIRKWLMTRLAMAGVDDFSIKLILGKEIPATDSTHLQSLEQIALQKYKEKYEQYLAFANGTANGIKKIREDYDAKIETLEGNIRRLEEENKKLFRDWEKIKPLVDLVNNLQVQKMMREEDTRESPAD
jgi:integrase